MANSVDPDQTAPLGHGSLILVLIGSKENEIMKAIKVFVLILLDAFINFTGEKWEGPTPGTQSKLWSSRLPQKYCEANEMGQSKVWFHLPLKTDKLVDLEYNAKWMLHSLKPCLRATLKEAYANTYHVHKHKKFKLKGIHGIRICSKKYDKTQF